VELAGEEYVPLGGTEFSTIISKIQEAQPDANFNTLNGDSNVAFFKQFKDAGFSAESLPVMSVSVAEEEVRGIGPENIAGHYTAWNYYETTQTGANEKFTEPVGQIPHLCHYRRGAGSNLGIQWHVEPGPGALLWAGRLWLRHVSETPVVRRQAT
jgi:hypothetical protein